MDFVTSLCLHLCNVHVYTKHAYLRFFVFFFFWISKKGILFCWNCVFYFKSNWFTMVCMCLWLHYNFNITMNTFANTNTCILYNKTYGRRHQNIAKLFSKVHIFNFLFWTFTRTWLWLSFNMIHRRWLQFSKLYWCCCFVLVDVVWIVLDRYTRLRKHLNKKKVNMKQIEMFLKF